MAFGLLLGLIGCAVAGVEGISRSIDDDLDRARAKRTGELTYMDSYGRDHLTENGRRVRITVINGQKVIQDIKTDKVYYNLTAIENAKKPKFRKLYRKPLYNGNIIEVTFWSDIKLPEKGMGYPGSIEYVEIFTAWNNEEMRKKFEKNEPFQYKIKFNEEGRKWYNQIIYDRCYKDRYNKYKKEKRNWELTFDEYIKMFNCPTMEEFVKKYNL